MSTEKKIIDYLHLYGLGLEVIFDNKRWKIFQFKNDVVRLIRPDVFNRWCEVYYADLIVPLSKLEDMTQHDIVHLFLLKGLDYRKVLTRTSIVDNFIQIEYKCAGELLSDYITAPSFRPEQFHYLLKKGYDLFGLIEAGLAVDKKTLKP